MWVTTAVLIANTKRLQTVTEMSRLVRNKTTTELRHYITS